jgi:hypothetical protein
VSALWFRDSFGWCRHVRAGFRKGKGVRNVSGTVIDAVLNLGRQSGGEQRATEASSYVTRTAGGPVELASADPVFRTRRRVSLAWRVAARFGRRARRGPLTPRALPTEGPPETFGPPGGSVERPATAQGAWHDQRRRRALASGNIALNPDCAPGHVEHAPGIPAGTSVACRGLR